MINECQLNLVRDNANKVISRGDTSSLLRRMNAVRINIFKINAEHILTDQPYPGSLEFGRGAGKMVSSPAHRNDCFFIMIY